jgi:hypothetical protein
MADARMDCSVYREYRQFTRQRLTEDMVEATREGSGTASVPDDTTSSSNGNTASMGEQAATAVQQTTSKAQASAGKLADQARQQIVDQLNIQKDRVTGSLESLITVLRQSSQQLRDQGQAPVATLANRAADGIEQVWLYLSERDVVALERGSEQFARAQPALFLTGTFALGFLGARFFKSSRQAAQNGENLPVPYSEQYAAAQAQQNYTVPPVATSGVDTSAQQPSTYPDAQVNAPYTRPSTAPTQSATAR